MQCLYAHRFCDSSLLSLSSPEATPLKQTGAVMASYSIPIWGTLKHCHTHSDKHIQHKPTRYRCADDTWLVLQRTPSSLGCRALEDTCPCCSRQSCLQWPFVHTSREKAACCKGLLWEGCSLPRNPRQMAKPFFPLPS